MECLDYTTYLNYYYKSYLKQHSFRSFSIKNTSNINASNNKIKFDSLLIQLINITQKVDFSICPLSYNVVD